MDSMILKYVDALNRLLKADVYPFDENLSDHLPSQAGLYRIVEKSTIDFKTIYVGKSKDLKRRISKNHFHGPNENSTFRRKLIKLKLCTDEESINQYMSQNCLVQFIKEPDANEISFLEHFFIAILRPPLND